MACPKCGCKVHYQFNSADFGPDDDRLERCAACRHVFDIEDSADDGEDEQPMQDSPLSGAKEPNKKDGVLVSGSGDRGREPKGSGISGEGGEE